MTSLWRKHILPFMTIPYGNRKLEFTPAYLGGMAAAFAAGAMDVVPFSAEDPRWGPSGDPELLRGTVRAVEVVGDGMDALIEVAGTATDALLEADPATPTGVRIVERYRTAGGSEFPVILAMVYTTRAPVIAGLRPWTRESAEGTVRDD
jgi:hypothetical protein